MLIFSEYGSALGSAVPFFVAGVNDELFLEDLDLVDQSMRIPGDMMLVDVLLTKEQSEKFIKEESAGSTNISLCFCAGTGEGCCGLCIS